ncbi:MAG: tetratricopeptide repeat protein [bacterium]|nr:tetratricopeptide repeat protein [bacterium]
MIEKKHILVADNTTSLVSPWKNEIKKYFNMVEVVGGFEALTKLKSDEYSAVIINLSLRTFNGMDVVIKIREKYKKMPIIVVAEKTDMNYVKNVSNYGIYGYFLNPVDTPQMIAMLTKITGISLAQLENEMAVEKAQGEQKRARGPDQMDDASGSEDVPTLYYQGQSFLLQGNVDGAMDVFNKISNMKKLKDTWRRYNEDALFQLARCQMKKNQYKDAMEKFNQFIQKAPSSELYKQAHFSVGECLEHLGDMNKALLMYKKVANMSPMDSLTSQARKKIKAIDEK